MTKINRSKLICEFAKRNEVLKVNSPSDLTENNVNKEDVTVHSSNNLDENNVEEVRLSSAESLLGKLPLQTSSKEVTEAEDNELKSSRPKRKTINLLQSQVSKKINIGLGLYCSSPLSDSDSDLVQDSDEDPEYLPTNKDSDQGLNKVLQQPRFRNSFNSREIEGRPRLAFTNTINVPTQFESDVAIPSTSSAGTDIVLHDDRSPVTNIIPNEDEAYIQITEPLIKSRKRWSKPQLENWKININKTNKKQGLSYKKGKLMPAEVPKPIDCSQSFFKCT